MRTLCKMTGRYWMHDSVSVKYAIVQHPHKMKLPVLTSVCFLRLCRMKILCVPVLVSSTCRTNLPGSRSLIRFLPFSIDRQLWTIDASELVILQQNIIFMNLREIVTTVVSLQGVMVKIQCTVLKDDVSVQVLRMLETTTVKTSCTPGKVFYGQNIGIGRLQGEQQLFLHYSLFRSCVLFLDTWSTVMS